MHVPVSGDLPCLVLPQFHSWCATNIYHTNSQPLIFDHPVETVVERGFDWLEFQMAALRGNPKAKEMLHHGSIFGGYSAQAPCEDVDMHSSLPAGTAQLLMLGIGIDMVHLPRMRQLVTRHAQRLLPLRHAAMCAASQPVDHAPFLTAAAQHFARRVLSEQEKAGWEASSPQMTHEGRLRFLATR